MSDEDLKPDWIKTWERLVAAYPEKMKDPREAFLTGWFSGDHYARELIADRIGDLVRGRRIG